MCPKTVEMDLTFVLVEDYIAQPRQELLPCICMASFIAVYFIVVCLQKANEWAEVLNEMNVWGKEKLDL